MVYRNHNKMTDFLLEVFTQNISARVGDLPFHQCVLTWSEQTRTGWLPFLGGEASWELCPHGHKDRSVHLPVPRTGSLTVEPSWEL